VLPFLDESVPAGTTRAIADYVAGMTDRFALQEHKKLFDLEERV
jgi:dGTPase